MCVVPNSIKNKMAVNTTLLLMVAILTCFHWHSGESAKIHITAKSVSESIIRLDSITCSAETTHKKTLHIKLMKLSTGNGENILVVKADGQLVTLPPFTERSGLVAYRKIYPAEKVEKSYVMMSMIHATPDLTGLYTCTVYFTDSDGKFRQESDSAYFSVNDPRLQDLDREIESLQKELDFQYQDIQELKRNRLPIAFNALANGDNGAFFKSSETLVFPSMTLNSGEAFNGQDGIFTATKDGYFAFHLSAQLYCWSCELSLELRLNDHSPMAVFKVGSAYNLKHDSISTGILMSPGDTVSVFISLASGFWETAQPTSTVTFSGHSIPSIE